jgi:hypothetical protein
VSLTTRSGLPDVRCPLHGHWDGSQHGDRRVSDISREERSSPARTRSAPPRQLRSPPGRCCRPSTSAAPTGHGPTIVIEHRVILGLTNDQPAQLGAVPLYSSAVGPRHHHVGDALAVERRLLGHHDDARRPEHRLYPGDMRGLEHSGERQGMQNRPAPRPPTAPRPGQRRGRVRGHELIDDGVLEQPRDSRQAAADGRRRVAGLLKVRRYNSRRGRFAVSGSSL